MTQDKRVVTDFRHLKYENSQKQFSISFNKGHIHHIR